MTKLEIAQIIASNHNRLSSIFSSGGIIFQNGDSVILMGDTLKDLRAIVQQLQVDIEAEAAEDEREEN